MPDDRGFHADFTKTVLDCELARARQQQESSHPKVKAFGVRQEEQILLLMNA